MSHRLHRSVESCLTAPNELPDSFGPLIETQLSEAAVNLLGSLRLCRLSAAVPATKVSSCVVPRWVYTCTLRERGPICVQEDTMKLKQATERLFEAAKSGSLQDVERSIEDGAEVNARTKFLKNTALHWAAHNGHTPVVELLIQKGANCNLRNERWRTLAETAAARGHPNIVALIDRATQEKGRQLR